MGKLDEIKRAIVSEFSEIIKKNNVNVDEERIKKHIEVMEKGWKCIDYISDRLSELGCVMDNCFDIHFKNLPISKHDDYAIEIQIVGINKSDNYDLNDVKEVGKIMENLKMVVKGLMRASELLIKGLEEYEKAFPILERMKKAKEGVKYE